MLRARPYVLILSLLILFPLVAYAQRDLTMNVVVKNPNDYPLSVDIWATEWSGDIRCSPYPRQFRTIAANGEARITCTAVVKGGGRNVELGGTADITTNDFIRLSQWGLRVLEGTHHFNCLFGCRVSEDWSACGSSGPCATSVVVTFDQRAKPPRRCSFSCQTWNPASQSCIGPAANGCDNEKAPPCPYSCQTWHWLSNSCIGPAMNACAGEDDNEPVPQKCPYSCQTWNPASRSCIGPAMNNCAGEPGQKCPYSCQAWNPASGSCVGAPSNACGGLGATEKPKGGKKKAASSSKPAAR